MRTYIIRAFLPWLIFLAFADGSLPGLQLATLGGAICLLLFNWSALRKKFLFDWASLIFFIAFWVIGVGLGETPFVKYSLLSAYFFLAIISFLSLLLKVPVALQHARTRTSVQFWTHPIFIGVNYWITIFWSFVFFAAGLSAALFYIGIGTKLLMTSILPVIFIVVGIFFTALFPDKYKAKMTKKGTVAALPGISSIKIVMIGHVKLAYRIIGHGPLLILAGAERMNMHHWDPDFLKQLSQNYTVLIFDYPGVGYSEYQQMPYTAKQLASYLEKMIDALKLTPSAMIGYSMGGMVAQAFACKFSKKIKALVLISTSAGGSQSERYENLKQDYTGLNREDCDLILKQYFSDDVIVRMKNKLYRVYDGAVFEGAITEKIIDEQKKLIEDWYRDEKNIAEMKHVKLPILLIVGKHDQIIPASNSQMMKKLFQNVKLVEYNDAGHGVIYQYPADIVSEINRFLGDL